MAPKLDNDFKIAYNLNSVIEITAWPLNLALIASLNLPHHGNNDPDKAAPPCLYRFSSNLAMESSVKPTTSVKLVLLGEAAVGKSSLVLRFVSDDFQENKEPTIGAAFLTQKCTLANRVVKFEIWDTAGQERFASLAPMYYRNAQSALVVYDVTKPASFIRARHWVNELKSQGSPNIIIALVGNKLDLTGEQEGQ